MSSEFEQNMAKIEQLLPSFIKCFKGESAVALDELDLTIPQIHVLNYLAMNDNCKMSDISTALSVTLSNMTSMIDRLIREGYVAREDDPSDRRIVRINLSNKGKQIIKKFKEHRAKSMKIMFQKMSQKDIKNIIGIIERVANQTKEGVNHE